jgi:hypothetical protein
MPSFAMADKQITLGIASLKGFLFEWLQTVGGTTGLDPERIG